MEIGLQHAAGVRPPGGRGGLQAIDEIAPIAGQLLAADHFRGLATGLGELAGDPTHPYHRTAPAVGEGHGHLQEDPELPLDGLRRAVLELFGAVPTLKQEAAAGGRLGQEGAEPFDLLGDHQGGESAQARQDALKGSGIGVIRLLQRGEALPAVGIPGVHRASSVRPQSTSEPTPERSPPA